MKDGNEEEHRQGDQEIVRFGWSWRQGRGPVTILFFEELQFCQRQSEGFRWDQNLPAVVDRFDPIGDIPCFQSQCPEARLVFR